MWRDTRDPNFLIDLSSLVSVELPLLAVVLRDYTLEFEIKVESALMDLRECLREAIRDRDYCKELADTLMEDIEDMSSAHESGLAIFRVELDRKGPAPLGIEAECVQLRSYVVGLEDDLVDLTQRFAALDHTWVEERAALEASRAETSSKANGLAFKLVQAKAYIHSNLSKKYGQKGDKSSELQLAFCYLQTELAEREEALRVATVEVGTLQALLGIERQGPTYDSMMERELVHLRHSHDRLRGVARGLGFDAVGLLCTHAHNDPILSTGFGRLCQVVFDHLGHV